MKDLGLGISYFWRAFGFIFKHNLWYYYLFPLVLMGLSMWGLSIVGDLISDWAEAKISGWFGPVSYTHLTLPTIA